MNETPQNALPLIPLPDGLDFRNPWPTQCDMLNGPCSCGAWHRIEDLPERIFKQLYVIKEEPTPESKSAFKQDTLTEESGASSTDNLQDDAEEVKCPDCNGHGWSWQRFTEGNVRAQCWTCEGEGRVKAPTVGSADTSRKESEADSVPDGLKRSDATGVSSLNPSGGSPASGASSEGGQ